MGVQQHVLVHLDVVRRRALVEHSLERRAHGRHVINDAQGEPGILGMQVLQARAERGIAHRGDEYGDEVSQIHISVPVVAASHSPALMTESVPGHVAV